MTNELSILIETLQNKEEVLNKILDSSKKQLEVVKADQFEEEKFDAEFETKDGLIAELNRLDEGFDGVYQKIKNELKNNLSEYKPQVASLQQLIRSTMDIGSEIHTVEEKVKQLLPKAIEGKKKDLIEKRTTAAGVANYYRASKMMDFQDAYFLDHKK